MNPSFPISTTIAASEAPTSAPTSDRVSVVDAKPISPMLFFASASMIVLSFRNVFNYIESPENISNYSDLPRNKKAELIHIQFCDDIDALKSLTETYVGNKYTHLIEKFYEKVKNSVDTPECSLHPLYQHLRFPIHKLVSQLKHIQDNEKETQNTAQQNKAKEVIGFLLNCILPTINSYSGGTHSWITTSFSRDQASQEPSQEPSQEYSSPINKINLLIDTLQITQLLPHLYNEAFHRGDDKTMCNLLSTGQCDLNPLTGHLNNKGQTSLSFFACKGALGGVKHLLEKGNVDVNQKDISQQTPLHLAVANGHIECVRQILLSPDVLVKEKDDKGNTALLLASSVDVECAQIVQLIVDNSEGSLSINIPNNKKFSPLMIAIARNNTKSAEILLNMPDIDMAYIGYFGSTALHCAAITNNWRALEFMLQRLEVRSLINHLTEEEESPLFFAAEHNAKKSLDVLLRVPEIDINKHCVNGCAALHMAFAKNHLEIANILLQDSRTDCNIVDTDGSTPLHIAASNSDTTAVSLLLTRNDINTQMRLFDGFTPREFALLLGNNDVANILAHYEEEH